jgi:PPK2 family polyphosphate:nucleotide phosphotransferase
MIKTGRAERRNPMPSLEAIVDRCLVPAGKRFRFKDHDPGWAGDEKIPKADRKAFSRSVLAAGIEELSRSQELLYASDSWAVLVVFQALDAAGKDGTIKHVMSGVNPQGVEVYSFKKPSDKELEHDFLWRCARVVPERGRIGIFNRSYYEDVLVARVHPSIPSVRRVPGADPGKKEFWAGRYESINAFEHHLVRNGTVVLKFYLNVSRDEQKKRFLERLGRPEKYWKFSAADLAERAHWDEYAEAYEDAISATSTEWAPWYVVPADKKWVTRSIVAEVICRAVKKLDLNYPEITPERMKDIEAARKTLGG